MEETRSTAVEGRIQGRSGSRGGAEPVEGCVAAFGRRRRLRWVGAADGGGGLVPGEVAAASSQVRRLDLKRGIARVQVFLESFDSNGTTSLD